MSKSTTFGKPQKPSPDFSLFAHATRRWAKKIRGKLHYFGPWRNPEGALNKYLDEKPYLEAGRRPPEKTGGVEVLQFRRVCRAGRHFLAVEHKGYSGLLVGDPLILLGNVTGTLGSPSLDAALTATTRKDRVLGRNENVTLPLRATWYAVTRSCGPL